jgi:stress-induced-phosphoprotein 1
MSAKEMKDKGNAAFKHKKYENALNYYSEAIKLDPNDHVLYSNRSVCYYNMKKFDKALEDADACIKIKTDFGRGYLRKGNAEIKLDKIKEAVETFKKGLQYDPNNTLLKRHLMLQKVY